MSSFVLKIFAIIFMLIDHIGYVFFPNQLLFRIIGRIAFPIFAFQIGIGLKYTKSKEKHIILLLLFAILSQIPFLLMCSIHDTSFKLNILFAFVLASTIIYCNDTIKNHLIRLSLIALLLSLIFYIKIDYGLLGVVLTICLYYFSENKFAISISLLAFAFLYHLFNNSILQLYCFISIVFIWLFNGKKGPSAKWLFYIFYPAHMLILFVVYKLLH